MRILLAASLLPLSLPLLRGADGTTTAPAAVNAQTEIANRQQLKVSANQAISDGQRFLASGNYDQAAERFQYAVDALTPGGVSANIVQPRGSRSRRRQGWTGAGAWLNDNKYAAGSDACFSSAVILQPNNQVYPADIEELKKQQAAYEEQVRDPEGIDNNPAVTDDLKARVGCGAESFSSRVMLFLSHGPVRQVRRHLLENLSSSILTTRRRATRWRYIEKYKDSCGQIPA